MPWGFPCLWINIAWYPKLERAAISHSRLSKPVRPGTNNSPMEWCISMRTELVTVAGIHPQPTSPPLPAQLWPCPPHRILLIQFHSVTGNIACHTTWRHSECRHAIPGNSVVAQFNFCISIHFFIALHQGREANSAEEPGASSQNLLAHSFSFFLYDKLV